MKKLFVLAAALSCAAIMTGCASLLERQYVTSDLHTSKFWESEAADILRAENRQDIVNDLLLLIGQHKESATLRLYNFSDDVAAADAVQAATTEVRQDTPMGAYAVEYITSSVESQRGYYEIELEISYRRSAEQMKAVKNATSAEAVASLLENAMEDGAEELVVRIGYWDQTSRTTIEETMMSLREEYGIEAEPYWAVNLYPAEGETGLVEFLLNESEPVMAVTQEPLAEEETGEETVAEGEESDTEIGEETGEKTAEKNSE